MQVYHILKKILVKLFPTALWIRSEPLLRKMFCPFYMGRNFRCNICEASLRQFLAVDGTNILCPCCGSLSRDRRLWELLHNGILSPGQKILDFSPSRALYRALKKRKDVTYESSVFEGNFLADHRFDITAIDCDNGQYDVVICYHVLEHIPQDVEAMSELFRICKSRGVVLVQTPFASVMDEDQTVTTAGDRLERYGQEDHVRLYSTNGLQQRLEGVGFKVQPQHFEESKHHIHGFKVIEDIMFCQKP